MTNDLLKEIESTLKGEISNSFEDLESASTDCSHMQLRPRCVVFPENSEDVTRLVRLVGRQKKVHRDLSLTCRSGGACVTGGPLNDSIIVDFSARMNRLIELSDSHAIVEPGMYYRDFDTATKELGAFLPPYPASRDICCVGGMVGNNSGGTPAFHYGKCEAFVQCLKVVLADGNEYVVEPMERAGLEETLRREDFFGEVHRALFRLLEDNYETLQKAKPQVSKNSAGYALWDVWQKQKQHFDLTQLFVGSQATLGIVTEIRFRLARFHPQRRLMVVFLNDVKVLSDLVQTLSDEHPEELEMYHKSVLKKIFRHYSTFTEIIDANPLTYGFQFASEALELLKGGVLMPDFMVLPKFTGESSEEVDEKVNKAKQAIRHFDLPVYITESKDDFEKYKELRTKSMEFFKQTLKGKAETLVFDDLCVRVDQLSEFVPEILGIVERCGCDYFMAAHIGNGNIHLVPFMDPTQKSSQALLRGMVNEIYDATLRRRGSITGEHNEGFFRTPFSKRMFGEEVYGLFKRTKEIFDPDGIFNPGKKIADERSQDLGFALAHMTKP